MCGSAAWARPATSNPHPTSHPEVTPHPPPGGRPVAFRPPALDTLAKCWPRLPSISAAVRPWAWSAPPSSRSAVRRPAPCPRGTSSTPASARPSSALVGVYFGVVLLIAAWILLGTRRARPRAADAARTAAGARRVGGAAAARAAAVQPGRVQLSRAGRHGRRAHRRVRPRARPARRAARRRGRTGVAADRRPVRPGLPRRGLRAVRPHPRRATGRAARHAAGRAARRGA